MAEANTASNRRPSLADRAVSSPQTLRINMPAPLSDHEVVTGYRQNAMTPPASPASSRHSRSSTDLSSSPDQRRKGLAPMWQPDTTKIAAQRTDDGTILCPYEVDILRDQQDRKQTFGFGAWSTVYKGTCRSARSHTSGLMTPPLSPHRASAPMLVAVKQPARKDAAPILRNEASVLSHLMTESQHELFIVPFFGIIPSDSSLVLEALPLSLEQHIKKCAATAATNQSVRTMTQPVVGSETIWLDLANSLISALAWLHEKAMVVHGDIKPGNILLSLLEHDSVFPYRPVFADFSSSQRLTDTEPTLNTLSAVTREYTAPELLSSKVLLDPTSTANTASDVFSLAVTLLVCATGNTMVYTGSVYQRQAMATQGWSVISHLRNSDNGLRISKRGVVERATEKAVLKKEMGRIDAGSWKDLVEDIARTVLQS